MTKVLVPLVLCLSLMGCASQRLIGEVDNVGRYLSVEVVFYDSEEELYSELWVRKPGVLGQTVLYPEELSCRIKALRPLQTNDSRTLVLGHELMHCLYGNYHR